MSGTITTVTRQSSLAIKVHSTPPDMGTRVPQAIEKVNRALKVGNIAAAGPAYARYLQHNEKTGLFELEVGVPVTVAIAGYGDIFPSNLPGGRVMLLWHEGPYATLGQSFAKLESLLSAEGLMPNGPAWESYVVGPATEPDATRWRTAIYQPI